MVATALSALGRRFTYANVASTLALVLALGTGTAYAANTVRSKDIVNRQVKTVDLAPNAVTGNRIRTGAVASSDIADNSVTSADIRNGAIRSADMADGSVTTADMAGIDSAGLISIGAGAVSDGACKTYTLSAPGTRVGQSVIISARAGLPSGVFVHAVGVSAANSAAMAFCNFSGGSSPALNGFPVRTTTFD